MCPEGGGGCELGDTGRLCQGSHRCDVSSSVCMETDRQTPRPRRKWAPSHPKCWHRHSPDPLDRVTGAVHGSRPSWPVGLPVSQGGRGESSWRSGSVALGQAPFLGASGHPQHSRTKLYSCTSPDRRLSLPFLRQMGWAGSWVMSQTLRWSQLLRGQISAPPLCTAEAEIRPASKGQARAALQF